MANKSFLIKNLDCLDSVADDFVSFISANEDIESNIFAFFGEMGVGKTTFIKALCKKLGVEDIVNSPTFTIVNEYQSAKGFPIYHFDFFRIDKEKEAFDIGIDEYFSGKGLCLIEWPEKISSLLPKGSVKIDISLNQDGSRTLNITY